MISEDVLPAQLRGRTPQEQSFILGQMATTLAAQNTKVQELERKLQEKGSKPGEEKPAKPARSEKPLEERVLEDAEGTIAEIIEKRYGGTIAALDAQVSKSALRAMKQEHDDWAEVEADVLQVIKDAQSAPTEENLELAYDVVLGRKARATKRQVQAASLNSDQVVEPAGSGKGDLKAPEGLEGEIFKASGMSLQEWYDYKGGKFDVKVPTGKRPKAAEVAQ